MKIEFINPFIASTYELFTTMLGAEARRGKVGVVDGPGNPKDLTAIIGLSGSARGTAILAFPTDTALKMVGRLLGEEVNTVDGSVTDAVAEMVNIVAGGAKAKLSDVQDTPIDLGLPTVVRGGDYAIEHPTGTTWLEIPFESDFGPFVLRITMEMKSN